MDINIQRIIELLGPNEGLPLVLNIFIYITFIFTLIALFLQSDKTILPTILLAAGLLLCIIAKLEVFTRMEFGAFAVNAGVFLAPTLVIGMTQAPKSRPPLIIAALAGAIYFFAFWFLFHFQN